MMKRKENSFSLQGEEEGFFFGNQRTQELIKRPLFSGTMWNWDVD